jgi:hypothetical protein
MSKWYSKSSTYFRNGKVCIGTDSQIGFLSSTLKEELLMSREAYDWIYYNGGQYITTKKGGKQGIADYKGKEIIPNMYDGISACSEGVVIMKIGDKEESKNGYYKLGYGFLTEVIYSYAAPFKNGTGVLKHSGAIGKCGKKGRISWTNGFFTPPSSTRNQPYAQWKKNYTFGDNFPSSDKSKSEDRVIVEGAMLIKQGAESAIIEILPNGTPGKILVPFTEDFLHWEGPSHFYRSDKLFISKTGEPVFIPNVTGTVSFDFDCYLGNNCFEVEKNDKSAIYDLTLRKLVTKFEYDFIGMSWGGSLYASKGNQDYKLDHSGKVISSEEAYSASSSSSSTSSSSSSSSGNASVEVDVTYKGKSSDPSWLYVFYTKPDGSKGNGDIGLNGSKTFTVKPGTTLQYVLGSHGQGKKSTLVTAPNSGSKDYELNLR